MRTWAVIICLVAIVGLSSASPIRSAAGTHRKAVAVRPAAGAPNLLRVARRIAGDQRWDTVLLRRYNMETGATASVINMLTKAGVLSKSDGFAISPNGKMVLWTDGDQGHCAHVNGADHFRFKVGPWPLPLSIGMVRWMPDSRHFTCIYERAGYSGEAVTFSCLLGVPVSRVGLVAPPPPGNRIDDYTVPFIATPTLAISDSFAVHWDHEEHVSKVGVLKIYRWPLRGAESQPQFSTVKLPRGVQICARSYSPDCSRIAWAFRYPYPGTPNTDSLWVSNFDGSHMRKIGVVPYDPSHWWVSVIDDLDWSPDGKYISFIYKDALYFVPAG
jgi:hypothetical protein